MPITKTTLRIKSPNPRTPQRADESGVKRKRAKSKGKGRARKQPPTKKSKTGAARDGYSSDVHGDEENGQSENGGTAAGAADVDANGAAAMAGELPEDLPISIGQEIASYKKEFEDLVETKDPKILVEHARAYMMTLEQRLVDAKSALEVERATHKKAAEAAAKVENQIETQTLEAKNEFTALHMKRLNELATYKKETMELAKKTAEINKSKVQEMSLSYRLGLLLKSIEPNAKDNEKEVLDEAQVVKKHKKHTLRSVRIFGKRIKGVKDTPTLTYPLTSEDDTVAMALEWAKTKDARFKNATTAHISSGTGEKEPIEAQEKINDLIFHVQIPTIYLWP